MHRFKADFVLSPSFQLRFCS